MSVYAYRWDGVDIVQGVQPIHEDLGIARRRDPDTLPPRNVLEWCLNHIYLFLTRRGGIFCMRLKLNCLLVRLLITFVLL